MALAGIATWLATAGGPRHDADSASYLWAARQLSRDPWSVLGTQTFDGVADPGRFPPLYQGLLWLTGAQASTAFVVVAVLLAMTTVALVVVPLRRHTDAWIAAGAGMLVLCARPFLFRLQAFVMSDAWFLACTVAAVAAATMAVEARSQRSWRWWVAATAVLAAAGASLRLAGVGLAVALAAALALMVPGRPGRLASAAVVSASLAPLALWLWMQRGADTVAARSPAWYGFGWPEVRAAADSWLVMALPGEATSGAFGVVARSLVMACTVLAAVWSGSRLRDARAGRRPALQAVWLLVGWSSLAALVLSRTIADPFLELTDRHLMTAWTAAACAGAVEFGVHVRAGRSATALRLATLGGAGLVAVALMMTASGLSHPDSVYRSLEDEADESAILEVTERLGPDTPLYTNRGDLLFVLSGRVSRHLPLRNDPATGRPTDDYRRRLDDVVRAVCDEDGAVMAVMSDDTWAPDVDDLTEAGLVVVERRQDGVLLRCAR